MAAYHQSADLVSIKKAVFDNKMNHMTAGTAKMRLQASLVSSIREIDSALANTNINNIASDTSYGPHVFCGTLDWQRNVREVLQLVEDHSRLGKRSPVLLLVGAAAMKATTDALSPLEFALAITEQETVNAEGVEVKQCTDVDAVNVEVKRFLVNGYEKNKVMLVSGEDAFAGDFKNVDLEGVTTSTVITLIDLFPQPQLNEQGRQTWSEGMATALKKADGDVKYIKYKFPIFQDTGLTQAQLQAVEVDPTVSDEEIQALLDGPKLKPIVEKEEEGEEEA